MNEQWCKYETIVSITLLQDNQNKIIQALDYDAYGPAYSIYSSKDMLDNHDVMSHHLKIALKY